MLSKHLKYNEWNDYNEYFEALLQLATILETRQTTALESNRE